MKWLVVIALAACGSSKTSAPATDKIDRSCQADSDCLLAVDTCCTGCGTDEGDPVNAKAWHATGEARAAGCKGTKCPDYNCSKPPDCRAIPVAVCKAGRCEKQASQTEACTKLGVSPDEYCEGPDDCTIALNHKCCIDCAAPVVNVAAAKRLAEAAQAKCSKDERAKCGEINCPGRATTCKANRCVEGM